MITEKELKTRYNIDNVNAFAEFVRTRNMDCSWTFTGKILIEDHLIDGYVAEFRKETEKDAERDAETAAREAKIAIQKAEEDKKKKQAMASMLITSGFNFDGYTIKKYSGYISGDDAISVDRGMAIFGLGRNIKDKLLDSLVTIRRNALRELKEAAYNLGCNAVIGVDFDYITLDPQTANLGGGTTYQPYIFCVTANGNAVIIEKNED